MKDKQNQLYILNIYTHKSLCLFLFFNELLFYVEEVLRLNIIHLKPFVIDFVFQLILQNTLTEIIIKIKNIMK
jgi:hypothetical protein